MTTDAALDLLARILIVDDEQSDRQLVEIMLSSEGYRLQSVVSGKEALEAIRNEPPDLILLDVLMPDTDGYQVAAEIKADATSKHIPIILFTALEDREARVRGLESGAEDFLSKPLDGAELRARVRNLLRLKAAYEELNRRNAEIAAALAEARDARKAAEEANDAKTQLLRVMSHELRTPLSAITGYAELLELGVRGAINSEQAHDVGRIRSAASYLTRLIGDVLTAEQLERPRELQRAPFAMHQVLAQVEDLCALQATAKGLTLTMVATDDVVAIADAPRVQQIMLNLVTNAIKFTPSGSIHVTCSGEARLVRVRVKDTGIGISSENALRVFDPFFQVEKPAHAAERGVGLGLSISRELARAMGGDLTLEDANGAGATFVLTLPAAEGSFSAAAVTEDRSRRAACTARDAARSVLGSPQ